MHIVIDELNKFGLTSSNPRLNTFETQKSNKFTDLRFVKILRKLENKFSSEI